MSLNLMHQSIHSGVTVISQPVEKGV